MKSTIFCWNVIPNLNLFEATEITNVFINSGLTTMTNNNKSNTQQMIIFSFVLIDSFLRCMRMFSLNINDDVIIITVAFVKRKHIE